MQDEVAKQRATSLSPIAFLGSVLAAKFHENFPVQADNSSVGSYFLARFVLVHIDDFACKHDVLLVMARKLYCFAHEECGEDYVDAIAHQELLLPGQLLASYISEKSEEALARVASHIRSNALTKGKHAVVKSQTGVASYCGKLLLRYGCAVGNKVTSFLASGNLTSSSGLDLQQSAGFVIVAERVNMWRYLSHFRAVHRGHFFTTMKTTSVRKLLPEAWGFLCPVHTPDGAPCGLLSHLAARAHVVCQNSRYMSKWRPSLLNLMISLGMLPLRGAFAYQSWKSSIDRQSPVQRTTSLRHLLCNSHLPLCIDGVVVGCAQDQVCVHISIVLRCLKTKQFPDLILDPTIEVVHFPPPASKIHPFAGLLLFSQAARLVRPVLQCRGRACIELIGPLEQMTLQIACDVNSPFTDGEATSFLSANTHMEIDPTYIFSVLASLTPFSDFNQSPRNMYQCQMGKQSMGTPAHSIVHRPDGKVYQILMPQSPLICSHTPCDINLDDYAQGTNSIVAVLSYTGYDMEDAMIINKSSYERGFGHGVVYKTLFVDLAQEGARRGMQALHFKRLASSISSKRTARPLLRSLNEAVAEDGLPEIGQRISEGEPLWCAFHDSSSERIYGRYKGSEIAYIHAVHTIGYVTTKLCVIHFGQVWK